MGSSLVLFIFSAVFFILSVIVLISFRKNSNHIQTRIQELMQDGEFEPLCQDFQSTDAAFYDGLGLAVSPHYLPFDFSNLQYGFSVYPLDQFYNVFKCNMVNGKPTTSITLLWSSRMDSGSLLQPARIHLKALTLHWIC